MYISYRESAAKGFKKWSVAHPTGSNDNDRPGDAHPMAAIADEIHARAVEVAHRLSFRL
jgi:hypothetical protein